MSKLFLLIACGIGAILGSLVTFWLERRPRKPSPEAIERTNLIYAEIAAEEIEPELITPRGIDDKAGALDALRWIMDVGKKSGTMIPGSCLYFTGLSLAEWIQRQIDKE
jgi:hypothetical protein